MKNIFDKRLSDLLNEKELSKRELGKLTGISAQSISDWSTGKVQPTAENIYILAKFFNVTTDYLLGLEDEIGTKFENNTERKLLSAVLTEEEIKMVKKVRLLSPDDQNTIKQIITHYVSIPNLSKEETK